MPRKNVTDLITDQEMAFARLVLGGTMNDREAAQAAGLNPDTASYTKSKPRVREYMLEHRAAVEQQLVAQQAEAQRQLSLRRERLLARLWAIADTSAEITKGSFTSQIKALAMIGAIDGLIPDRCAGSSTSPQRAEKESTPAPVNAQIYEAAWLRKQKEKTIDPEPSPEPAHEEETSLDEPEPAPEPHVGSPEEAPPISAIPSATTLDPISSQRTSWVPDAFLSPEAPDTRVPFSIQKNRFGPRR